MLSLVLFLLFPELFSFLPLVLFIFWCLFVLHRLLFLLLSLLFSLFLWLKPAWERPNLFERGLIWVLEEVKDYYYHRADLCVRRRQEIGAHWCTPVSTTNRSSASLLRNTQALRG